MEKLGMFTAAGLIYLLSGVLSVALSLFMLRFKLGGLRFSARHTLFCGGAFALYMLCLYLSVGMARTRAQVIEVGLLNYLWPALTLLFSVPILNNRARVWIAPGIITALAGVYLASVTVNNLSFSFSGFISNVQSNAAPYALASAAAVLWALYSNLARKWASEANSLSVPVFLLLSGILLEAPAMFFPEKSVWSAGAALELALIVLFPCITAYILWDWAMRRGNMILVASFAYFTPLLSTVATGLYLGVPLTAGVWTACALVTVGAIICKLSIIEPRPAAAKAG
jgi:drug/metabolite transporter (DMT)-like permease